MSGSGVIGLTGNAPSFWPNGKTGYPAVPGFAASCLNIVGLCDRTGGANGVCCFTSGCIACASPFANGCRNVTANGVSRTAPMSPVDVSYFVIIHYCSLIDCKVC